MRKLNFKRDRQNVAIMSPKTFSERAGMPPLKWQYPSGYTIRLKSEVDVCASEGIIYIIAAGKYQGHIATTLKVSK